MLVAVWLVALCGVGIAAPQDAFFNFEKSVVVGADNGGHSGIPHTRQVTTVHKKVVHAPPPPPSHQVVRIHKTHSFDRQAAEHFHNSASGQALDNAGAQLFSALGNSATSLGQFLSNLMGNLGRASKVVVTERRQGYHAHPPSDNDGSFVFVKTKTVF